MRILHTADWHLGKRLEHVSRLEEQRAVLEEICKIADDEAVDAVLIAGDLFDNANPPIEALELFYATLRRLAAGGQRAVIGIAGNHDAPDRIAAPDPLARASGILLAGYPAASLRDFSLDTGLRTLRSGEGWVELKLPGHDTPLRLLLTPYANSLRLRKALNPEDTSNEVRRLLADHWKEAAEACCDSEGVNILVTHLLMMEAGQETPEESEDERTILSPGGLEALMTDTVPSTIDYVALGHLHRPQRMREHIVYSGSPLAYSMSEAGQQKSVVIIDAEPRNLKLRRVPLTEGRPLARKHFTSVDEAVQWLEANPEALVELTLSTSDYLHAEDRQRIYKAHSGIIALIPQLTDASLLELTGNEVDLTQDMNSLFKRYFFHRQGQDANEEIMNIFKEVLGEE
ncbi:MAG: exonuclease SbcCD subunit D [Bacteroidia bacterium]